MSLLRRHSARKAGLLKKSQSRSVEIEYTVRDLPSLRRQRTIAYNRAKKALEVGLTSVTDESQRDMFYSYHQDIKKIASQFENAHLAILELLDDPDDDTEVQERFDEMFYKINSIYLSLNHSEPSMTSCNSSQCSSSSNVRLPKIVLKSFSGDIKQFPEYLDTFNSLINNSKSLSDTEKFHYLISSLSGDALSVVRTFPLTSEYYRDAYNALIARYKCKRDLAFTCWRDLLELNFNFNNAHEFRKSLDLFEENLCILKSVNLPVNHWDFVLVYHLLSKLETTIRRDFEEKYSNTELPSYIQLKEFLHSKCEALLRDTHFTEQSKHNKLTQKDSLSSVKHKQGPTFHTLIASHERLPEGVVASSRPTSCPFCNESHTISACSEFLNKSIDERMQIATDKRWCFNCLKSSHQLRNCNSIFSCRICRRKHHSLLHREPPPESNSSMSSLVSQSQSDTTVLLATSVVQIQDASGRMHSFRALFDTGSQSNFITESAVKQLNLKQSHTSACVSGLGQAAASISGNVTCHVGTNNKPLFTLELHVLPKICGEQPTARLNTSGWSHIKPLKLADPDFDVPGPIDILFAADVFADSLLNQRITGNRDQPAALNSIFGWLLLGRTRLASTTVLEPSETEFKLNSNVAQSSQPSHRVIHSNSASDQCNQVYAPLEDSDSRFLSDKQLIHTKLKSNIITFWPRFQAHHIGSMADDDMYRLISILSDHREYERIFWKGSHNNSLMEYYLNTVMHVLASHACYSDQLRAENEKIFNFVANRIFSSATCNDDVIMECDSPESAQEEKSHCTDLIEQDRFAVKKCVWKDREPFFDLLEEKCHIGSIDDSNLSVLNVLCLNWDSPSNSFNFKIRSANLTEISAIFKPFMFLSPVIIQAKYFLQNMWILNVDWKQTRVHNGENASKTQQTPLNRHQLVQDIYISCIRLNPKVTLSSIENSVFRSRNFVPIATEIVHNLSWWAGPKSFSQIQDIWPSSVKRKSSENVAFVDATARKSVSATINQAPASGGNVSTLFTILNQFSSLQTFLTIFIYIHRLLSCFHNSKFMNRHNGCNNSLTRIVLFDIISNSKDKLTFLKHYHNLNSLPDKPSFLRVGGEVFQSLYNQRCPAIPRLSSIRLDPPDFSLLLPRHILASDLSTAELDKDSTYYRNTNRLYHWHSFHQNFWSKRKHEYLNSLRQRAKWTKDSKPLTTGSMVVIKDENRTPLHWPFARLTNLIPGPDGVVRIAELRTASSNHIQRPLVKLCPRPIET